MADFPPFITNHPIFKHYPIKKVFPLIGLHDQSEVINIEPDKLVISAAEHAIFLDGLLKHVQFLSKENNKNFKFSDTIPLQNNTIEFSSNAFDLITMSMRGLSSCVNWEGERKRTLIGSIIDPYCGMIYIKGQLPDTEYGSRIIYRSVVRIVENKPEPNMPAQPKKYSLFMERIYATSEIYIPYVKWIFTNFLKTKIFLPITLAAPSTHTIPLSEPVKELIDYDHTGAYVGNQGFVAYRDSQLQYGTIINSNIESDLIAQNKPLAPQTV